MKRTTIQMTCFNFFYFDQWEKSILEYFRNSSCKLILYIVRLWQWLSPYYYLKVPKFFQCHRQVGAPQERSVPVTDHSYCWHIPKILWKQTICFSVIMAKSNKILDVTNEETNKVMEHRCWIPSLQTCSN